MFYVALCFSIFLWEPDGESLILLFFALCFSISLGTWVDTCIFWPAFGSNYSNALVLQEHCIQCHPGKETAHGVSTCDNV